MTNKGREFFITLECTENLIEACPDLDWRTIIALCRYGEHVVCAWIGNSRAVARDHHLQLRDSDFERAAKTPTGVAQKAAQLEAAETRGEPQGAGEPEGTTSGILVETGVRGSSRVTARQPNGADESRTHDLLHAI